MMKRQSIRSDYTEEAKRLAFLSKDDQKAVIAIHRDTANNRKLPKADRDAARERADALEQLLKLPKWQSKRRHNI
jgi:hypothetical protein